MRGLEPAPDANHVTGDGLALLKRGVFVPALTPGEPFIGEAAIVGPGSLFYHNSRIRERVGDHSKRAECTRSLEQGFLDTWKGTGVSNFFKQRKRELRKRRMMILQGKCSLFRAKAAHSSGHFYCLY